MNLLSFFFSSSRVNDNHFSRATSIVSTQKIKPPKFEQEVYVFYDDVLCDMFDDLRRNVI